MIIYPQFLGKNTSEIGYNYQYTNMKDVLILEGKNYISAKRAALVFGYTSDYVGQMCREGKLDCKMLGRTWFVKQESVHAHKLSNSEFIAPAEIETPIIETAAPVETPEIIPEKVQVQIETPTTAPVPVHPISFVPRVFALPYFISPSFLTAPARVKRSIPSPLNSLTKISLGFGVFAIAFVFIFQSTFVDLFSRPDFSSHAVVSSVASLSQEILGKIISAFSSIPTFVTNLFEKKETIIVKNDTAPEKPPPSFNGLAVVSSSDSVEQDEAIKQKIRDSFSDEVRVKPDKTGTSGIITPVFRKAKGDDFVYVLVPVNN